MEWIFASISTIIINDIVIDRPVIESIEIIPKIIQFRHCDHRERNVAILIYNGCVWWCGYEEQEFRTYSHAVKAQKGVPPVTESRGISLRILRFLKK